MVCFEMVTYVIPFENCSIRQAAFKVVSGMRPPLPSNCPQWMFELITACWQTKPEARPPFSKLSGTLDQLGMTLSLRALQQLHRVGASAPHAPTPMAAHYL